MNIPPVVDMQGLGADVVVFRRPDRLVVGAVGVQVFLPSGSTRAFSSDGGVLWPAGGARDRGGWSGPS